jgi:hypothetical protein
MQYDHKVIPLNDIKSASVRLDIKVGEVLLEGGDTDKLVKANFKYNVRRWKPKIQYRVKGGKGFLRVKQGRYRRLVTGNGRNKWDLRLNNKIPVDLDIDFGAGEGRFDLSEICLRSLNIDMGVGDLNLDLRGNYSQDIDINIDGGIGSAKIYLPENLGVRVRVDGGIGSVTCRGLKKRKKIYTNRAYGKADFSMDIDIDGGIGSIDLISKD